MPQIRIEHSANLSGAFEPTPLALSIHHLCVEHVNAALDACKSRIIDVGDVVTGDGTAQSTMLHVDIGLLKGRTTDAKSALADAPFSPVSPLLSRVRRASRCRWKCATWTPTPTVNRSLREH